MSGFLGRLFGKNEKQLKAQKITDTRSLIRKNEGKLHEQERSLEAYKDELKELEAQIEELAAKRDALVGANKEQASRELVVLFKKLEMHKESGAVILRNIEALNLMISKGKQLIHGLETDTSTEEIDDLNSELQLLEDDLQEQTLALQELEKTSLFKYKEVASEDLDRMLAAYHRDNPVSETPTPAQSLEEQLAAFRRDNAPIQEDVPPEQNVLES